MRLVNRMLVYFLCFLLALGVSCRVKESPPPTLAEIGLTMHISFPSSTRLVYYDRQRGMDDVIFLKVEIPRADIGELLEKSPFAGEVLRTPEDNPIPPISVTGPEWWEVESVKKWQSGQARLPNAEYLNILIDLGRKDMVVVYLEWGQT